MARLRFQHGGVCRSSRIRGVGGVAVKPIVDVRSYPLSHCWFCGGRLPPTYTSVVKRGMNLPVHYGCRPEAMSIVVEDHADFLEPGYPIG